MPRLAKAVRAQIARAEKRDKKAGSVRAASVRAQSITTLWKGDELYDGLGVGSFEGRISLLWNGMDSFVYRPDFAKPFSYTTSKGKKIEPKLMETDGGSIPRVLRGLSKFSSWGYAPAFILHDWLFVAHKCDCAPDNAYTFDESALLMAEAIKTLMKAGFKNYDGAVTKLEKAEDTLYLMYQGVASRIAKNLWNDLTTVRCMI